MRLTAIAALALLTVAAPAGASGDGEAGEQKAVTCTACHGAGGAAPISPQYPVLAGQYADYLAQALYQYQSGQRKNAIMAGLAAALSAQDIEDLAAYFASVDSPLRIIN